MTTIAPPGCECQPEDSPGWIVILATTICNPGLTVRLPWDNVPWPNRTLTNPGDAGVAAPGTALATTNSPTNPTVITVSRIARLVSVFIRDSFAQVGLVFRGPTGQCARPAGSSFLHVRIFLPREGGSLTSSSFQL